MKYALRPLIICLSVLCVSWTGAAAASDDGVPVDKSKYADRQVLADFTEGPCSDTPRGLEQIKGNLYRHTSGGGLAVHSGLVLVTREGALVIDPASSCTATWLLDEIKRRFDVSVAYVVYTHAHAVGERIPTALPTASLTSV